MVRGLNRGVVRGVNRGEDRVEVAKEGKFSLLMDEVWGLQGKILKRA